MPARIAPRQALRQTKWILQRRAASSTGEAVSSGASKAKDAVSSGASKAQEAVSSGAAKAKEATQDVASKAQSGLSRVTSSAGSVAGSTVSAVGNTLSGIGGRTGQVISYIQSLVPPTVYYAKVVGELGRMIVTNRGMNPPTMQHLQTYAQPIQKAMQNPSSLMNTTQQVASQAADTAVSAASNPQSFLTRLRNLDQATLISTGIVAAEGVGFFTIGEMIGRFKLIGYHGDAHAH